MALHFPLMVNGEEIGRFEAVLIELDEATDVGRYQVTISNRPGKGHPFPHGWYGVVEHNRADGPWHLIRRAIEAGYGGDT